MYACLESGGWIYASQKYENEEKEAEEKTAEL